MQSDRQMDREIYIVILKLKDGQIDIQMRIDIDRLMVAMMNRQIVRYRGFSKKNRQIDR